MKQIDLILGISTEEQFKLYKLLDRYGGLMDNSNRLALLKDYLPSGVPVDRQKIWNEINNHKFVTKQDISEKEW
jgi:hypothetical protein